MTWVDRLGDVARRRTGTRRSSGHPRPRRARAWRRWPSRSWCSRCSSSSGRCPRSSRRDVFHDLSKLMFAFVMLWAYFTLLAVPHHLVRQPARGDPLLPGAAPRHRWGYRQPARSSSATSRCRSPAALARAQAAPEPAGPRRVVHHRDAARGSRLAGLRRMFHQGGGSMSWPSAYRSACSASWAVPVLADSSADRALLPVDDPYFKEMLAHGHTRALIRTRTPTATCRIPRPRTNTATSTSAAWSGSGHPVRHPAVVVQVPMFGLFVLMRPHRGANARSRRPRGAGRHAAAAAAAADRRRGDLSGSARGGPRT